MAVVQGVKEKVHLPIYDSLSVAPKKQLSDVEGVNSSVLKLFVDVQGKTKLETNLQSASLLPHYNTFEARAMRVVISDLKPEFPDDPTVDSDPFPVVDGDGKPLGYSAGAVVTGAAVNSTNVVQAAISIGLSDLVDEIQTAENDPNNEVSIPLDDDLVDAQSVLAGTSTTPLTKNDIATLANAGAVITLSSDDLSALLDSDQITDEERPLDEQIHPNNGAGTLMGKFVYNTVTSFYVGEKLMIQMPTWFFPAGGGVWNQSGNEVTHGEPTPLATFRFAEPIFIDKQQNFRVEIEIPDSEVFSDFKRIYGPFVVWVVLDGYMTRDVQ